MRKREDTLGQPLQLNNLGQREYAQLIRAAGVRKIKFHGMRHTCATLLLQAGQPVHVVAQRLGHSTDDVASRLRLHRLGLAANHTALRLPVDLVYTEELPTLKAVVQGDRMSAAARKAKAEAAKP